jgi:hypothetical protein
MALPSFFKTQQPRSFNFMPRYYNERKEKLQERVKNIELELGVKKTDINYKSSIGRGSMRGYIDKNRSIRKKSNIRLFIILGSLLLLVYLLLYR